MVQLPTWFNGQPGRHAPCRHGRGPRRAPVVTDTPPLDWRVTEVEKNLGQLVDLVGTLTAGVQSLQAKSPTNQRKGTRPVEVGVATHHRRSGRVAVGRPWPVGAVAD